MGISDLNKCIEIVGNKHVVSITWSVCKLELHVSVYVLTSNHGDDLYDTNQVTSSEIMLHAELFTFS